MNYKKFLTASTLFALGAGMSGVYWIARISQIVGEKNFGFAVGISIIVQSFTSLIVGKYVVKQLKTLVYAQVLFTILTALVASQVSFYAVFVIEAAFGIAIAIQILCSSVLIAEITEKEKLGKRYGFFYSLQSIAVGISMVAGSFIALLLNVNWIFLIGAAFTLCSTILLSFELTSSTR